MEGKKEDKTDKNAYTQEKKFEYCGKVMGTVIIEGRAACVMTEPEYNRLLTQNGNFGNATDIGLHN